MGSGIPSHPGFLCEQLRKAQSRAWVDSRNHQKHLSVTQVLVAADGTLIRAQRNLPHPSRRSHSLNDPNQCVQLHSRKDCIVIRVANTVAILPNRR